MLAPKVGEPLSDKAQALRGIEAAQILQYAKFTELLDSEIPADPQTLLPKFSWIYPLAASRLLVFYLAIVGSGSPNRNGPTVRFIRLALSAYPTNPSLVASRLTRV
jgi:hypothetical protein